MTVAQRKSLKKIRDDLTYYPHQILGIRDLASRNSFLLADEMGLGKSIQALTVAAIDYERGWASRTIIVAPASLKWNWRDEIEEHTHFTCMVLDGTPSQRLGQIGEFAESNCDILIVNYEQVIAHVEYLNQLRFDIAIYDEAHYLKSPKTKRSKACQTLKAGRRFLLTGSPLLNQVNELWGLLKIIDPAEFPNYWRFVNRYAVFGGFKDKQIVGVKNEGELNAKLSGVMLRRLKKDVLDLPEKQYITIKVDLHPKQQKMYDQAADEMKITGTSLESAIEIENAMVKFLRLKQICGSTATIDPETDFSSKLDIAEEKIAEIVADGSVVPVFTQFRPVQTALVSRLESTGIKCFILNGDTPTNLRTEVVKEWGRTPGAVLVAMLQVAGVGLNMTQANKCAFIDKLFVPKLNEQAEDRIHRIGADKTKPIQIIEFIARNTVEQRIETILRRKRKLFDTLVEESNWKKEFIAAMVADDDEDAA